ncbi:hypothetical protein J6590_029493 [Homalodisca vitripennis]|nr:hypothetical protein J6590_029493 [Homalodisca vitripennis]
MVKGCWGGRGSDTEEWSEQDSSGTATRNIQGMSLRGTRDVECPLIAGRVAFAEATWCRQSRVIKQLQTYRRRWDSH